MRLLRRRPLRNSFCSFVGLALALIDRNVWDVYPSYVFRFGPDECVIRVLFENMARPACNSADGEDRREEIKRNAHHVVSRSGIEIDVGIQTLLAHHNFFYLARDLMPLRITSTLTHFSR